MNVAKCDSAPVELLRTPVLCFHSSEQSPSGTGTSPPHGAGPCPVLWNHNVVRYLTPALQMKSQFRSIAPKAPAMVPSPCPGVLSCPTPSSIPEATVTGSKSIIVPTQNYALMQIAGQDGTFSLVALPPSVSSPTQQQPPTQPLQKNLKLPIPRYQPMRKKGTSDKVKCPTLSAKVTVALKVAEAAQSASSVLKNKTESQLTKITQVLKEEASEKVILIDPVSSDVSVMSQLPENTVLYPGSHLEPPPDVSEQPAAAGLLPHLQFPTAAIKGSPGKYRDESKTAVRLCQSKPASAPPPSSFTVLSPAIFGKAIQIIPSPLNGKLPILPYSKMKSALVPAATMASSSQEKKLLSHQAGHNSPTKHSSMSLETADSVDPTQMPKSTPEPRAKTTPVPVQGTLQKAPSKKRGRKRKTLEDILAFEARKKRSLSFFRRRIPEKPVVSSSKQKEVDISKKYRSIRPKPLLLMETVPQLVSLPTTTPDSQEQELILGHPLPATITSKVLDCPPAVQESLHPRGGAHPRAFPGSRPVHRCPSCSRCFQFKHHLQSHVSSHANSRPYVCPACRKAYAHSGSLSTHMKLHHSEVRPRRSFCCEFCQKAFGYVGVYFSHLREVHKVLLTVEPSISHHEHEPVEGRVARAGAAEDQDHEDPAELQIKCGRCQTITPTFTDMKMHLLYVHEEEVPVRLSDDQQLWGGRQAENDLVKHAAHYWRQLKEKRNPVKCGSCDEEFFSIAKLKRHIKSCHQSWDGEDNGTMSPDSHGSLGILAAGTAFNCVLCSRVLDSKQEVLEHWRGHHHCEQPELLWDALSSYSGQDRTGGDLDSPDPSLHSPA
ncbi:zinc finger protein 438 isoform X3 [Takifugu flavidus]|nr:zinc finger protein 438 isoform X3 [Takifugu flavidus]